MERGRYRTKQQEIILNCLMKQKSRFLTVDQFMECLHEEGVRIGQTTVYRFLERLVCEREAMRLPIEDGSRRQYCYVDKEALGKPGKLVCLMCGRFISLECSKVDDFLKHIYEEHGFEPDGGHLILYGYCDRCKKAGAIRSVR